MIKKSFKFCRIFHYFFKPYSAQEPSYIFGFVSVIRELASPKMQAVIPEPQLNALSLLIEISFFKDPS